MGTTIKIIVDQDAQDPRKEWDNFGTMVCFHRRYDLGDEHNFSDPSEFIKGINEKDNIILPLYLYDHSGITMRTTPFQCPWDSGQVGWIYISKEKVREEYGCKAVTKKIRQKALDMLRAEVATYDQYLTGDVYGFVVEEDGKKTDACWGFYGRDPKENGMEDHISKEVFEKAEVIYE